jgi:predicted branched-subunit amino acid permease
LGAQIPESWALDFAIPITFLAMIAPMFRTAAHVIAALVAVVVSLLAAGVPYSLGLIIAGIAGMIAGAQAELWLERKGHAK